MLACLGWGSLIWDPRDLPIEGEWQNDGPHLPVEFSRVSTDGRLTLVVTRNAALVQVLWASLAVASLDDGIRALAEREGIPERSIGHSVGVWSIQHSSTHNEANSIGEWGRDRELEGVIWTALKPGFPNSRGQSLTRDQAIAHVNQLDGETRRRAEEYIQRTPSQVSTRYRPALEREISSDEGM